MTKSVALLNGKICTMSPAMPWAEALAAEGGSVFALGTTQEVQELLRPDCEVIDLRGRLAVPGLIDSHIHFLSYALSLHNIDLREVSSIAAVVKKVRAEAARAPSGEWILGRGWDKNRWTGDRRPTKYDLDAVAPHHPVALGSKDGHALWVNSLALQRAGLTEAASSLGAQLERFPDSGDLTGVVKETAVAIVEKAVTPPGMDACEDALREAMKIAQSKGLTGIQDMEGQRAFVAFQNLYSRGELGLRVLMMIPKDGLEAAARLGLRSGFGHDFLRIGGLKLFADGALGSQTAALCEPYEGSVGNMGIMVAGEEELTQLALAASRAGINVAIHTIGDSAVHAALNALAAAKPIDEKLRHRLEHIQLIQLEDLPRFGDLGVIASIQPIHATADRDIAEKYWGERCARSYPYQALRQHGAVLACGSDAPVESLDPLKGLFAAVTRRRVDEPDREAWHPEQRLSLLEALRGYTLGAAYAAGEELSKGSLEAGKLADVVVLSQDVFALPLEEIARTHVEQTILAGQIVYSHP